MARIGIYYHSDLDETAGGVARVSCWLAKQLLDAGNQVFSLVPYGKKGITDDRCETLEVPWRGSKPEAIKIQRIVKDKRIDLIINQCSFYPSALGLSNISAKIITVVHHNPCPLRLPFERRALIGSLKGRLCLLIHNTMPWLMERIDSYRTAITTKKTIAFSQAVCTLSDSYSYVYSDLCKRFGVKSISIPNPIPFDISGITNGENVVIWVGRMNHYEKRVDWLLEIWERAVKSASNWKLLLIGDGPERNQLEMMAKQKGLNVGFVGRTDPRRFYKRASLICLTSPSEGFPLVLPEAMAYGVVPILFDSFGAAHDIVTDGITGFLAPPFDLDVYASKLKYAMTLDLSSMREAVRIKAREFNCRNVFGQWEKLIDEIVAH